MNKGVTGCEGRGNKEEPGVRGGRRRGQNDGTKEYSTVLLKFAENGLNTSGAAANTDESRVNVKPVIKGYYS